MSAVVAILGFFIGAAGVSYGAWRTAEHTRIRDTKMLENDKLDLAKILHAELDSFIPFCVDFGLLLLTGAAFGKAQQMRGANPTTADKMRELPELTFLKANSERVGILSPEVDISSFPKVSYAREFLNAVLHPEMPLLRA